MKNLGTKILIGLLIVSPVYAEVFINKDYKPPVEQQKPQKSDTEARMEIMTDIITTMRQLPKDLEINRAKLDGIDNKLKIARGGIIAHHKTMQLCMRNNGSSIQKLCEKNAVLTTGKTLKEQKSVILASQAELTTIISDLKESLGGIDGLKNMLDTQKAVLELRGVDIKEILISMKKLEHEEQKRKKLEKNEKR